MAYGDKSDTRARDFMNRPPDQVAYVVENLEEGIQRYGKLMGIPEWVGYDYDANYLPNRFYDGKPGDFRSLCALPAYGPSLEIIQPIDGPSVFTTYLEARGPGLHHLGWFVPDLSVVREHFTSMGLNEIMSGNGQGVDGDGEFLYFDTFEEFGSYIEFIQIPERRYDPHFKITVEL